MPVCTASINEKQHIIETSQRWYAYQAITKWAPGFPLTMGMNGLKVNYKLGREVAAKMSVVGFEAPVLNPQTRNERHKEDAVADDM